MKKVLVCLLSMAFVLAMGGMVLAKVSGPCVNCHTMHNSQGGAEVNGDGPFGALVNNTCLGCHTTAGSDPLSASGFPYVKSTSGAFTDQICLAGGYFPAIDDGTANLGKAHSLANTAIPPGSGLTGPTWYTGDTTGLSCAGTAGC
ncbi:MAG: cytochrome c3 family protein, partial [Desulfovibrionales bacterium]|nr:cytochrome c3 family protein [Desulfovibrionales bacterium]